MNNVWYSFISFLKKLFVPPTYTTLEHELLRQISWLEGELHRSQERNDELLERFVPRANRPESNEEDLIPLKPSKPSWETRRSELEEESRRRKAAQVEEYIKQQEALLNEQKDEEEAEQGS